MKLSTKAKVSWTVVIVATVAMVLLDQTYAGYAWDEGVGDYVQQTNWQLDALSGVMWGCLVYTAWSVEQWLRNLEKQLDRGPDPTLTARLDALERELAEKEGRA